MQVLAPEGRPIPADSRSNDRWFQHIAIITRDMDRAYGWPRRHKVRHASPGPQRLPDWNPDAGRHRGVLLQGPRRQPSGGPRVSRGQGRPKMAPSGRRAVPRHRPHGGRGRGYRQQPRLLPGCSGPRSCGRRSRRASALVCSLCGSTSSSAAIIAATRAGQLTQASRSSRASRNACATAFARSTSSPFMRCRRSRRSWAFRTSLAVRACMKVIAPAAIGLPCSRRASRTAPSAASGTGFTARRGALRIPFAALGSSRCCA